ncbi:hypothetical protein P43SY_009243 [Pythium insidiosum]|uniref:Man1/Src1-like C-terminal domain-containing protein n=1 Tax=Pythium insidiosum TaxID=114742 RepID=A0AAD5M5N2_PYTIN|nr:hypothetical protein P43SY_009243 [Pythium insidiosum]
MTPPPPPSTATPASRQPSSSRRPPPKPSSTSPPASSSAAPLPTSPEFLSPVSKFNRAREHAQREQQHRMNAVAGDRVHRLVGRHSAPSAVKRRLTEIDSAAAEEGRRASTDARLERKRSKKARASSPTRPTTNPTAPPVRQRPASHGGMMTSTKPNSKTKVEQKQAPVLSASALKRHNERHSEPPAVLARHRLPEHQHQQQPRYLTYEKQEDARVEASVAAAQSDVQYTPPPRRSSLSTVGSRRTDSDAKQLFSRHKDPSVRTPPESTTSSPFRFTDYESSISASSPLPVIHSPAINGDNASPVQLTPRADDGMLDLAHVSTVSRLEAVEALLFAALLGWMYHKWGVYKDERALVDRLVKEVRWFLLGRTQRTERFYPANHLRDNLFDTLPGVSPRDRTWLRDHVWPKVAALVAQDSRVCSRIATVHGNHMVVWEWISSHSPQKSVPQGLLEKKRKRNQRKRYSI